MLRVRTPTKLLDERTPLMGDYGSTWPPRRHFPWASRKLHSWSFRKGRPRLPPKEHSWASNNSSATTVIPEDESVDFSKDDSPYMLGLSSLKFWLIFGPILVQYFVAMFDSFLMVSSHPIITSYFNASNSAAWLSTAFMLTSAALQPTFGRMSDMWGRRPVYLSALVVFAIGTAWCAAAQTIGHFIAGRAICGLGAGALISMGNIVVNDLVKMHARGTYQAYINLLYGGGAAAGAAFGGYLCGAIGWRATFAGQVPFVLFAYAMAHYTMPNDLGPMLANEKHWSELLPEFDLAGSFFLFVSVASLILGLNLGGNIYSWDHPIVLSSLLTALIAAVILINVEKKAQRPIMPLKMITAAPRANLIFANFFTMVGSNHILFNAPIYFEVVHGDSPAVAGLRISSPALCTTVCGVLTGFFLTWTGRLKAPQVVGGICMVIGGIATSMLWETTPAWLATLAIIPPYAGQGFLLPSSILGVLATSSQEDQAVAVTNVILWRNLGIVMGVALSSLVLQNALVSYLQMFVTGADKAEIIEKVRLSVKAVQELEGLQKIQVISAYSSALKLTFISGLVFFLVVNFLLAPIELPRLGQEGKNKLEDDEY